MTNKCCANIYSKSVSLIVVVLVCSISLALNESIVGLFYAPAMGLFAQYCKDGGVPDSEDRQQTLDGMIEICHALMNSYKSVADNLYAASISVT